MEGGAKDLQPATSGRPTGFGVTTPAAFQRLTPACKVRSFVGELGLG